MIKFLDFMSLCKSGIDRRFSYSSDYTNLDKDPSGCYVLMFQYTRQRLTAIMRIHHTKRDAYSQLKLFVKESVDSIIHDSSSVVSTQKITYKQRWQLFVRAMLRVIETKAYVIRQLTCSMELYEEVPLESLVQEYDLKLWEDINAERLA